MIGWPWHKKTDESLGLDIGTDAIRMVRLVRAKSRINIERPIEMPILREKNDTQQIATLQAIKKLIPQLDTSYRKIAIALADWRSLTLKLKIDSKAKDIKNASLVAASNYFSYPLDLLSFDFRVLKQQKSTQEVEGIFYPKVVVQNYEALIKASGFKLVGIELTSHALARGFQYLNKIDESYGCWGCVQLESNTFTALFFNKGVLEHCATDWLQENSPPLIAKQIYQKILSIMNLGIQSPPEIVRLIGDHEYIETIAKILNQSLFALTNRNIHQNKLPDVERQWNNFYVALGLALR